MADGGKNGKREGNDAPKSKKDDAKEAPAKRSLGRKILRGVAILLGVLVVAIVGFVIYVNVKPIPDFSSTPLPQIQASKDPEVIKRGSYVAHSIAHCSACHGNGEFTQKLTLPPNVDDLRGGYVIKAGPFGTYYPSNITPDNDTGIGKLSDPELARVIKHGVAPNGRLHPFMSFAVGP